MNSIVHTSIFDKLAFDLRSTPKDLRDMLYKEGVDGFYSSLRLKCPFIFNATHSVNEDFCDNKGNLLISSGQNLADGLRTIIEKYYSEKKFSTAPLMIRPTEEISEFYKFQIKSIILREIQNALVQNQKLEPYFKRYMTANQDAFDQLENFFNSVTESIGGINLALDYISNLKHYKELFNKTVSLSFLSLMVGRPYFISCDCMSAYTDSIDSLLLGCFFQSSFDVSGNGESQPHPSITDSMCKNRDVVDAIRLLGEQGNGTDKALFNDEANNQNDFLKIMRTVNLFISVIDNNNFQPSDINTHKNMHYLAESGYASKEVVELLSDILLPTIKARIMSYAYALKSKCPENPVILGLSGDMLPIKIVCTDSKCKHAGLNKILMPEEITVKADKVYETNINKGIYYTCEFLTNKLRSHFKTMVNGNI